jgi:hemolysin activation/secretion protein
MFLSLPNSILCRSPIWIAFLTASTVSTPLLAIDAGSQLRRFQDETRQRMQSGKPGMAPLPELPPSPSQAAAAASSTKTHVAGFEVHGVTRFSEEQIALVLKAYVGRDLDTADIHAAATTLTRYYRDAGYMLAKVFVPPQTFGQIIRLDVEEGYLEANGIEVQNKGSRVRAEAVQSILEAQLYSDAPLQRKDLERALLLADDLPGTSVGSVLYPGQEVGTARLRTVMSDEPLLSGNIDVDNFNSRQIGQERLGATIYVNSPTGVGDQIVTRLVTSGSRSNYAYLTYLRPVSSYGTRVGASIDYFNYDANALYDLGKIDGYASDARLYVTHPLVRSRFTNVNLRTDYSYLRINDRRDYAGMQFSADRRLNLFSVALSGDETHDWVPNGITLFDASVTGGNVNIEGDSAWQQYDASGPRTAGGFARFNFNLQRLQHITGPWSLFGRVSGQLASGNLDPSQRFYLGGATSVAGYPIAETSGDQGIEIHAEVRRDFAAPWGGNLQAGLFYEQGWVQLLKNTWNGWNALDPSQSNHVTLQTAGLQVTQTFQNAWVIRGLVGWQVGSDDSPVKQVTGNDSDGRSQSYRAWFQIIRYFGAGGS